MFPNQQNQNNGYPPVPQPPAGPQPGPGGQYSAVPPLVNTGASGHNPYEFIMESNNKPSRFSFGGNSFGMRIGLIAGLLLVVIIVMSIVLSALKPKSNVPDLIAIAQRQQEIVRITDEAAQAQQIADSGTLNFIMNTNVAVATNQFQVIDYLKTHDSKKLSPKVLGLDASDQTDTQLTNAAAAGNYDSTVVNVTASQLETYESLLQSAYKHTTSKSGKQLLQQSFDSCDALLKQAKSLQGDTSAS